MKKMRGLFPTDFQFLVDKDARPLSSSSRSSSPRAGSSFFVAY
jgi:hypothetical protein